ncbi:MAG: hypothetical protein KC503_38680 [Myxococcales bacterium]|nr:hypothetical protein [Myxococcales bacterium]
MRKSTLRCERWLGLGALLTVVVLADAPARADDAAPAPPSPTTDPTLSIPGMPALPSGSLGGPTPPPTAQPRPSGISGSFGGSITFEKVQEDYFITPTIFNQTTIGPVTFGVQVPIRLRVWDRDPQDDGVLRKEDWDEPSDYLRLLRFVEVNLGGKTWRFRGRFGALDGESIGHGTIMAGYYNWLDVNHYQGGLVLDAAIRWGGLYFMVDNIFRPEIFGFRLHVRPLSFITKNSWANKLIVGFSTVVDTRAPLALADIDNDPNTPAQAALDDDQNFVVSSRKAVKIIGFDIEYALIQNKLIDLVPYIDINVLAAGDTGVGMHLGTFFNIRIPTPVGPTLLTRLEYRVVGDGYAPRYIDSVYEAQRYQFDPNNNIDATTGLPLTKLGWLRSTDPGTHGWLGELYFDFAGWVKVGGTYEDYQGPNNAALTLGLHLPKFSFAQLGGYFTRRGFDGFGDAFDLDGALLIGYLRVKVWGPLALTGVYRRTWRAREDGTYTAQSDFSVGVGVSFGY